MRAVSNPKNPWRSAHTELLAPEPLQPVQVFEEEAKSVLTENDSPDVPFRFAVNPYRGCHHGCAYCYARPTHQYLDFGAGTDFERKLIAKVNAPELLRRELGKRQTELRHEAIAFSGVTDCYQPIEATYELTRRCLIVCRDLRQPAGVITKGALVQRDADLLAEVHAAAGAFVHLSIPTDDAHDARALEPYAPSPERRFDAMAALHRSGVPVGVAVAPIIPGWNDHRIPGVLQRAKECGAETAFLILLRLPAEVLPVFTERVREALPQRADKVLSLLGQMRGTGGLQDARFGKRMRGEGARWQAVEDLFKLWCRKLGLRAHGERSEITPKARPVPKQGELFG
ncbi:MAG: radical SAM protein [Planctomycetota bacterium]